MGPDSDDPRLSWMIPDDPRRDDPRPRWSQMLPDDRRSDEPRRSPMIPDDPRQDDLRWTKTQMIPDEPDDPRWYQTKWSQMIHRAPQGSKWLPQRQHIWGRSTYLGSYAWAIWKYKIPRTEVDWWNMKRRAPENDRDPFNECFLNFRKPFKWGRNMITDSEYLPRREFSNFHEIVNFNNAQELPSVRDWLL